MPGSAVTFIAVQLGIQVGSLLSEYAASRWRSRHPVEIRDRYGYRAFCEPFVQFRLNRWLYALCWTGSDRPSALFDRATAWLIAQKVLLPGVTTLERNIARVRNGNAWKPCSCRPKVRGRVRSIACATVRSCKARLSWRELWQGSMRCGC